MRILWLLSMLAMTAMPGLASASEMNGGPVELYDASGNGISSTTNWLNVDIQNASIPVSQSGTWNINNISGTISLPTGAATSANQSTEITSLGTIVTNTGNTNTSVQNTQGSVGAGTAATKSDLVGGVFNTVLPTLTNTQQSALQLNASGELYVILGAPLPAGSAVIGAVTQSGGPWTSNITQVGGAALALGQTTMTASIPVVIASNQTMIPTSPGNATAATYVATITGIVPASAATDIVTITGSGTKTIRIWEVRLLGSRTTGAVQEIDLVKRSSLDTGGTSTPVTATLMDSGDAAATSTVTLYTANPSALGTSLGKITADLVFVPDLVTQLFQDKFADFGNRKAIVLENANENMALNFGGVTVAGGSFAMQITWTEQ